VLHLSPDAGLVDVWAAGGASALATDLAYGQTSGYLELDPGSYDLEVYAAGGVPGTDTPLHTASGLALADDQRFTAVAAGITDAGATTEDEFRVLAYEETFTASATEATVRIVHGVADGPEVGVDLYTPGTDTPCDQGNVDVDGLTRFGASVDTGSAIPAGMQHLAVCADLDMGGVKDDLVMTFTADLTAGSELFLLAGGLLSSRIGRVDPAFSLYAAATDVTAAGEIPVVRRDPFVYVMHAVSNAGPTDVCVAGGGLLAGDLSYGQIVGPLRLDAEGNVPLLLHADAGASGDCPGTGASAGLLNVGSLPAGSTTLVTVAGLLASGTDPAQVRPYTEDLDLTDTTNARVSLVHDVADVDQIDAGVVGSGSGFGEWVDVDRYGYAISTGAAVAPGTVTLQVGASAAAGEDATSSVFDADVTVAAGDRGMAVLAGASGGAGIDLWFVTTSADGDYGWSVTQGN